MTRWQHGALALNSLHVMSFSVSHHELLMSIITRYDSRWSDWASFTALNTPAARQTCHIISEVLTLTYSIYIYIYIPLTDEIHFRHVFWLDFSFHTDGRNLPWKTSFIWKLLQMCFQALLFVSFYWKVRFYSPRVVSPAGSCVVTHPVSYLHERYAGMLPWWRQTDITGTK